MTTVAFIIHFLVFNPIAVISTLYKFKAHLKMQITVKRKILLQSIKGRIKVKAIRQVLKTAPKAFKIKMNSIR